MPRGRPKKTVQRDVLGVFLRIPKALINFIDLFADCMLKTHGTRLNRPEALLTLVRRGLMASPEMPQEGDGK